MRCSRNPRLAANALFTHASLVLAAFWILAGAPELSLAADSQDAADTTFRQYCFGCHGKAKAGGIDLQQLTADSSSFGVGFHHWEKVIAALEEKRMPPPKLPQPDDARRHEAVKWVRARLDAYAEKHAGDPGKVTVRRLTSGEYTYAIQDLTGVELRFDRDFASDSVGGEGFANFGDVQFVDDATLERYLEAARRVAEHAVLGSGPLTFFEHAGKSGFELSAVHRIQKIYHDYGFRAVAGEGARPYGLDRYGKAYYAAWRYRYRDVLGEGKATLEQVAAREGITPRFARHIWALLNDRTPTYPISDVIARWNNLPVPTLSDRQKAEAAARAGSVELQKFTIDWTRWLFAAGPMESAVGDDRVFLLTDESLQVKPADSFSVIARGRGQKVARVWVSVKDMNPVSKEKPVVTWRNGSVRVRQRGNRHEAPAPQRLRSILDEAAVARLGFGRSPDGREIGEDAFALQPGGLAWFDVPVPEGAFGVEVKLDVELPPGYAGASVLRATISDHEEVSKGRTTPVLLGNANHPSYRTWKAGLLEFARRLPQNSHGEPTPSDRDPIPLPFNNTYNQPERDRFHAKVKYYRDDAFVIENILDDDARVRLDEAWTDLLSSFDYFHQCVAFIGDKYSLDLAKGFAELDASDIEALSAEPRQYVKALRAEYDRIQNSLRAARAGHVDDAIRFAARAWRRPLTTSEEEGLRSFYRDLRSGPEFDHTTAVRSLLARVLVAPAFLYRFEQPAPGGERQLSDWEIASRLSFFIWSSLPDQELRRAAAAGELSDPKQLERQAKRMLSDPRAQRLATEFFGQWLGFYRFDQYRGVDAMRFPEFTDQVKTAMYEEAVAFFEHIVRKDRPVGEMFTADYTFLNQSLAKHYGVNREIKAKDDPELVEGANEFHRGGLLRLGAVLTATSAPLRTSPVKRGDWLLRRILGTPTPPPPADAGSIPADEKAFGGLTLFEKLEAHKRNASCAGCHNRIDPLGFPMESFDAVGRWRETYNDGKPVHNSASLADGTPVSGIDGLLAYLKKQEPQVLKTFSSKLLGYALGRTVLASDQPLIKSMVNAGSDARFSQLITEIVTSRQFRYRREDRAPAPGESAQHPADKTTNREGGL